MRRSALLTGGAALACGWPAIARADAATIRIATLTLDASACCYYADQLGNFKDAGIDAQIMPIGAGSTLTAVAGRSVDVAFANLSSVAAAYKHNVPLTLVAPADVVTAAAPTNRLLIAKGSTIARGRDLEGKTVATNSLRTITQLIVQHFIDADGGDSKTVKFVEMGFPAMTAAVAAGRIDAGLSGEPFIAEAREMVQVWADPFASLAPRLLVGVWFGSRAWAEQDRALAANFTRVMARTAEWANAHHAETAHMLASIVTIPPPVIAEMVRATYSSRFDRAEMQPLVDIDATYGVIPATFPIGQMIFS